MLIQTFPSGPFATNAYVVACSLTHEAAIIDPAPESSDSISKYLDGQALKCTHILLTHSHWDHIAEVSLLKERYQVPVYVHKLDAPNLEEPGSDGLLFWLAIPKVKPDFLMEEGMIIAVGQLNFQVIHTPGHSGGSVCFYESAKNVLFSGDTLFKGSIGNISFPGSQPTLMWTSLDKLAKLPPVTTVYPGHGPSTTLANETWLANAKHYFG